MRACFAVQIVDDCDEPLPPDHQGEIVTRPLVPFCHSAGYYGQSDVTLKTYRNLWLHTGDVGSIDAAGNLHFTGRRMDSIRRRGENLSPDEIENVLVGHPKVLECAAVGVPDEISGEEVKACIIAVDASLTAEEIWDFCDAHLPAHMVPRFVEFLAAFEKTASSQKIQRQPLRQSGVANAFDRTSKIAGLARLRNS